MTRLDAGPEAAEGPVECSGPRALGFAAREVPLGGVRAMEVHRSLPQRELPMVGAWCFLDRFGPQRARMRVEPHPHIGLQTVTWPFVGRIRHRDAVGSDVVIARGQLNLMTSGAGISHSEYSVGEGEVPLDALQLWVALPESRRHGEAAFERHERLPEVALAAAGAGDAAASASAASGEATVVLGELAGVRSPASAYTPIVGAELRVPPGGRVVVPLTPAWEHALVGVEGRVRLDDEGVAHRAAAGDAAARADATAPVSVGPQELLYLGTGRSQIVVSAPEGATLFLLGGEPFEDDIVMWWNFVGRSHEEIVAAREAWEAGSARFGHVVGHGDERVPAPPLPHVRLTRRRRML